MGFLFVGLNNPGPEYENTRHNAGAIVLQEFCNDIELSQDKYLQAYIGQTVFNRQPINVIFPTTFMNESGLAVKKSLERFETTSDKVFVFHDDIDIPLGEYKISQGRGHGGQNGIRSIFNHLDTKNIFRVRIGIARPEFFINGSKISTKNIASSFVLGTLSREERNTLYSLIPSIKKELLLKIK